MKFPPLSLTRARAQAVLCNTQLKRIKRNGLVHAKRSWFRGKKYPVPSILFPYSLRSNTYTLPAGKQALTQVQPILLEYQLANC